MPADTTRLVAKDVVLAPGTQPFSETFDAGAIVGLAGLDGHGQEAFLATLAGLRAPRAGEVVVPAPRGPARITGLRGAVRRGIAYLPRDRRTSGIFPTMSVIANFAIADPARDRRFGLIDPALRRARFARFREMLSIVAPSDGAPITALSGGNQQKVLLARVLALAPRVLLLDDPTRGVDVRTRHLLYDVFRDLAGRGLALVMVSTEIEELEQLCDRVLVFRDGSVQARLVRPEITAERIIAAMFGRTA
jgi:ribose transport system ATP-binding protein